MSNYPLFDVPWLVRAPNDSYMSKKRHETELKNQAVVDDYFIARDQGASAKEARRLVGEKHQMSLPRTDRIIRGFFEEAKKRRKYDFLQKYAPLEEHILDF